VAHKKLRFDTDARKAMEIGVNKLADAVRTTLGPKGQYAVLHKPLISPTITNDGVTIAQEIDLRTSSRTRPPSSSRRSPSRPTMSRETARRRRSSWHRP